MNEEVVKTTIVFIKVPTEMHRKMKIIALQKGQDSANDIYLEAVKDYISGKERIKETVREEW